jgi:hypothetical protein
MKTLIAALITGLFAMSTFAQAPAKPASAAKPAASAKK